MAMKWPWQRAVSGDRLVVCQRADSLAWVMADRPGSLRRCGVEQRGADSLADFARRLRALGLPTRDVSAVLPLHHGQLLQVDAPAVKPEEMKAAARWRIKDLVDGRLDDMTIDVMMVGDDRQQQAQKQSQKQSHKQIFVAAASNSTLREVGELALGAGLQLTVVELMETAQRNLQTAIVAAEGLAERASAALVLHGQQCLLTICARGELFYTRRLDWDSASITAAPLAQAPAVAAAALATLDTVDFIDYGADEDAGPADDGNAPRLVIELQRSFDVWERSWPDLPLAGLWLQVGDDSPMLAATLEAALGLRVQVLDAERVFPGLAGLAGTPEVAAGVLPLLGALLRQETRQL
jgi:MSHA biogenesis protein MshI